MLGNLGRVSQELFWKLPILYGTMMVIFGYNTIPKSKEVITIQNIKNKIKNTNKYRFEKIKI